MKRTNAELFSNLIPLLELKNKMPELYSSINFVYNERRGKEIRSIIYAIQQEVTDAIKIGITTEQNFQQRVSGLQSGSPTKLCVLAVKLGDGKDERDIHKRLEDYRLFGEWFTPSHAVIAEIESWGNVIPPIE